MSWRVEDVCVWLGQHNLGALEPAFRKHEINGAALALMDIVEFSYFEDVVLEHEPELQQARAVLLAQRKNLMVGSGGGVAVLIISPSNYCREPQHANVHQCRHVSQCQCRPDNARPLDA
jgi:4-diphosphocytidyl-2C-methyl-D-erythritol kinase